MAIIGIQTDRRNPPYTIDDFCLWIPKMSEFIKTEEGIKYFNKLYPMLDRKIFYSIFGTDWEYAMSLGIAHYLTLIGAQLSRPTGSSLADAAAGNNVTGVLTGVSVGGFSKSFDLGSVINTTDEAATFWNQSQYGVAFYALMKTKSVPSIFVVTDGNPYQNRIDDQNNGRTPENFQWTKF